MRWACATTLLLAACATYATQATQSESSASHPQRVVFLLGDMPADTPSLLERAGHRVVDRMVPGVETVILGGYRTPPALEADIEDIRLARQLGCELLPMTAMTDLLAR